MKLNNKLLITFSIFTLFLLSASASAEQADLQESLSDENKVVVNVDFKVTEQFSGLKESASAKRQMAIQYDEWQEIVLDKYFVKYKVVEKPSDEGGSQKLFIIETELLNSDKEKLQSPSLMTEANTAATIKITGNTINEPEFNLSFEVISK